MVCFSFAKRPGPGPANTAANAPAGIGGMSRAPSIADWTIAAALFGMNALIVLPFLRLDFSNQPWNNDYLYIGITRLFRDHPWNWSPFDYGGAPFRYIYPPLFHLLSLAIPGVSLGRAFHVVSGVSYALAPAVLFLVARTMFSSRVVATLVGAAYSVMPSPAYYLLPGWHGFAQPFHDAPWGFVALIGYAEAPHALSLVLMLASTAAAFRNRWVWGAIFCAGAMLANWAGALALLMMLAALWIGRSRDLGWRDAGLRVGSMGTAAYGLSALWITPAFVKATLPVHSVLLQYDYVPGSRAWVTVAAGLAALAMVALAASRSWKPAFAFSLTFAALTGAVVCNFSLHGLYLVPVPHRSMLELSVAACLLLGCALAAMPRWRGPMTVAVLVLCAFVSRSFVAGAWEVQPRGADPATLPVARAAGWLKSNAGSHRVLVSGELGHALKLWSDTPQASGPGQGIWNFTFPAAHRQVALGCEEDSGLATLWLKALNIAYVVVQEGPSREFYHAFAAPSRFRAFPVAWTDGAGDTIYRTLPAEASEAVVVDLDQVKSLGTLRATSDREFLERYVDWSEGKRPARIRWNGQAAAEVDADTKDGEGVLVKINHHPGWTASGARVDRDPLGFLLLRPVAGAGPISIGFRPAVEVLSSSALALCAIFILLINHAQRKWVACGVLSALATGLFLAAPSPPGVEVAAKAFERIRPPMINGGGIVDGEGQGAGLRREGVAAIYGSDFGGKPGGVRASIGGRPAQVLDAGANLVTVRVPADAPQESEVWVEVDGCRSNSFVVAVRDNDRRSRR